jgi:hypothetical protein
MIGLVVQAIVPTAGIGFVSFLVGLVFLAFAARTMAVERSTGGAAQHLCRVCGATWYGASKFCPNCGKEQSPSFPTGLG